MVFKTRLFLDFKIERTRKENLSKNQIHFLMNVLRMKPGEEISIFNSHSGEWIAKIIELSKKKGIIEPEMQIKLPKREIGPWVAFAPVKKSRTDFIIEKATELGVERLIPVKTKHTEPRLLNANRLLLMAQEAAEQCGRLSIPDIFQMCSMDHFLESWPKGRHLFYCDETGQGTPIKDVIGRREINKNVPCGFFIGPEGGFSSMEISVMRKKEFAKGIDLGPRILRTETAAVAALSTWNALTC